MSTNISKKEKKPDIYLLLLPYIIGILACLVCLAGSTFAWYTACAETGENSISLSNFMITAEIDGVSADENGVYTLPAGEYELKLVSSGTATGGFAILRFGGDSSTDVHTAPISTGNTITIKLTVNSDTTLRVIGSWGTSSAEDTQKITFDENFSAGFTYP